jgi:hypothetical protein
MPPISFRGFGGEIPRLPSHLLPERGAAYAANCDLAHGEMRGLRGNKTLASGIKEAIGARPIKSVYTEDGAAFYGWAYDAYVVKSQVVDDTFYRIYYTLLLDDGPIIKVARLKLSDGTPIIGTARVLGSYQPPENSNPPPVGIFGSLGPDSWVLGVPAPRAQGVADDDALALSLDDRKEWPGIPRLRLRVIYFLENPTGQIVAQLDISNNETANKPATLEPETGEPWVHDNVFYTNSGVFPNHRVQDLLSALGPSQRPYKYYFFDPPALEVVPIARTLAIENTGPGNIIVEYGAATPDPTPGIPGDVPPDAGADPADTGGGSTGGGDGGDQA